MKYYIDLRLAGVVFRGWFEDILAAQTFMGMMAANQSIHAELWDCDTHKCISRF